MFLLRERRRSFILCHAAVFLACFLPSALIAAGKGSSAVRAWPDSMTIPTSQEGLPDPNPPFDQFREHGPFNYPYTLRHNLVDRRTPRKWRTLNLENKYLKCSVLPDLGGHLYTCTGKINGASMYYANQSIKFARIALPLSCWTRTSSQRLAAPHAIVARR